MPLSLLQDCLFRLKINQYRQVKIPLRFISLILCSLSLFEIFCSYVHFPVYDFVGNK